MATNFVIVAFEDLGFHSATWVYSLGRLKTEGVNVWHRHVREMTRPYIIQGTKLIYTDSTNQVHQTDKIDSIAQNAHIISPTLNRGLRQAEYSLTRLVLRYEAAAASALQVFGTGDGGITFPASFKVTIPIVKTNGRIRRAIQTMYVTGTDLRFKIVYPNDAMVYIRGGSAEIMQRGKIGGLDP